MKRVNIPERKMPISLLQHFRSVYFCPEFPEYPTLKDLVETILDIDIPKDISKSDFALFIKKTKEEVIASHDFRTRDTTALLEMIDTRIATEITERESTEILPAPSV